MEFFEKLGKKASETYKSAAEKTNKIANETKLKLKMNENKSKINDIYTEIGKKVYQKYVLDGELDIKNDIQEELTRISELSTEIENYEKQILELSDMRQCVKCKNKIEKSAKFCPACGAEQPVEEVLKAEVVEEENSAETKAEDIAEDTETIVAEVVLEEEKNEEN